MELKEKLKQIKKECEIKALREFETLFLLETGLELGQEVMCNFFVIDHIGYQTYKAEIGIIKKDDNGCLFVESKIEISDYYSSCSRKKSYICKKSIMKSDIMNILL